MKKQIITLNGKVLGVCTSNHLCYEHNNEKDNMRCHSCYHLKQYDTETVFVPIDNKTTTTREKFVKFVDEQFGYDIVFEKTDDPDTYEKLFNTKEKN